MQPSTTCTSARWNRIYQKQDFMCPGLRSGNRECQSDSRPGKRPSPQNRLLALRSAKSKEPGPHQNHRRRWSFQPEVAVMRQGPHCTQTGVATYPPSQPVGQCTAASTVDVPAKRRSWPAKRCGPLSAASSSGSSMWRRAARRSRSCSRDQAVPTETCTERARPAFGFPPSCTCGSARWPKKWGPTPLRYKGRGVSGCAGKVPHGWHLASMSLWEHASMAGQQLCAIHSLTASHACTAAVPTSKHTM